MPAKIRISFVAAILCSALLLGACSDGSDSRRETWDTPMSECFWQIQIAPGRNEEDNHSWPDLNAAYRVAVYTLPEEVSCMTLEHSFPHARYMSLSSYHGLGGTIDILLDKDIVPDTGSINPFVVGSPRNASTRQYTFTIKAGEAPNCPLSSNVLEASDFLSTLMYRIYLPDENRDADGDAGLPRVTLHMTDGSILQGDEACDAVNFQLQEGDDTVIWYEPEEYAALRGAANPAKNPPPFRASYNFEFHKQCDFGGDCSSVPESGIRYPFPDPHYLYSFTSRDYGEVLVLRGKMPVTPRTFNGVENNTEEGEVRYLSVCSFEYYSRRAEQCLFDEQIEVNDDGFYTIVVTRREDKPDNATPECGVTHLSWSAQGDGFGIIDGEENNANDGFVLFRNLIPSPDFPYAPPPPTSLDQEEVMGDYLTRGRYLTRSEFEGLGCNPWLALPYDTM